MAMSKPMTPWVDPDLTEDDLQIDFALDGPDEGENPEPESITENDDGSVDIVFGDEEPGSLDSEEAAVIDHNENLAETIDEKELAKISSELMELFESDKLSRKDWEDTIVNGMDQLGVKVEDRTKPWSGACGVYHPLLAEAVVRFEAQAIMEIFPPAGPAKTRIVGKETPERLQQAERVQQELNYILVKKMPEYRADTESLLFQLPMTGSSFRKVYYDPHQKRPKALFVPAEDFVVSYGESDLSCAERFTHVQTLTKNELKKLQLSGFYRNIDIEAGPVTPGEIQEKRDDLSGERETIQSDRYMTLEVHLDYDLPGYEHRDDEGEPTGLALPYVITIDKGSGKVLSIRRNWSENDEAMNRRSFFVDYRYLPGLGFYGFGLVHLIGGITKSATSILRQLVDAGTLSNLPGGLKSRGLRIKGDDTPIRPGEWRDVDVAAGKVSDSIMPLPYKEPSMVLYQLLGNLVDEGRRIGSIADLEIGDGNQEAPVGTTLALMERALKVMSAVQARLHASLQRELMLIADIVKNDMGPEYEYDVGGNFDRREDFAAVEIIPVSDPGATTMSERVIKYQAVLQLASTNPQLYDMAKLHRGMLLTLDIKDADSLVPLPEDMKPVDPVSENMALLKGEPIKAFLSQDHDAHIQVHMAMAQDPKMQAMIGQSPQASTIQAAMAAHISEHLGFQYRKQIEEQMGTALPNPEEELSPEIEVQISRLSAEASKKLLQQHQSEAAQEQAQKQAQDPIVQMQAKELELKERELESKSKIDLLKMQLDSAQKSARLAVDVAKTSAQLDIAGAQLGAKVQRDNEELSNSKQIAAAQMLVKVAEKQASEAIGRSNGSGQSEQ